MARGRIIVTSITMDKRVNDLSNDTSRLAFTWLITFADREGRTYGDPAVVRSMLFPRRKDVTVEQVEGYIAEWAECGIIDWYEASGDLWISFPSFRRHQRGFDQRHEPDSAIPEPGQGTDVVRTFPVPCTAEQKRTEENRSRSEENVPEPKPVATTASQQLPQIAENCNKLLQSRLEERGSVAEICDKEETTATATALTRSEEPGRNPVTYYAEAIGRPLTRPLTASLERLTKTYGPEFVLSALEDAVDHHGSNFNLAYVKAILERWRTEGRGNSRKPQPSAQSPPDPLAAYEDWTGVGQRMQQGAKP